MFDIETKNNNSMRNQRPRRKSSFSFPSNFFSKRFFVYCGVAIAVVLVVAYFLYQEYYSNYNYLKEDRSEYLVYTSQSFNNTKGFTCEVPYINIDSEDARNVNAAISNFVTEFFKENSNNILVYDSELNGEVLSVVLRMTSYSEDFSYPEVSFHTYNFNLSSRSLISDQELLSLFSVTEDEVSSKIEEGFREFYDDEVYKGYIVSQECDYECFLGWRGVDNYLDSVSYYVRRGKLIAFRPFTTYSAYGEEDYFTDKDFEFVVAKG